MKTVIVAKALVIDDEQNCLIMRRSDSHPVVPLTPDLPGGQLDEDESPRDAVIREIVEETGLIVRPEHTRLEFATTEFEPERERSVVRCLFVTRIAGVKPDVQISWEHSEAWWAPAANAAQELTHPEYVAGVQYILEHNLIKDTEER
ncbi:MAG TPA: NUDIX domain-containing protein [Candidatus Saccharimonadales bacterium]|nr:NUDIX domain-containing protein [Candidatus Saccharimonadales bacterium]